MAKNSNVDMGGAIKRSFSEPDNALRQINAGSLIKFDFDYYAVAYPTATQEVYTYRTGGPSGTVVGTVTINYVDGTKARVANASVVVP
jgi:hypothetical protein